MRVLAASFPDHDSARAARERLISRFTLDAREIGVESLARDSRRHDAAILAGRFRDDIVTAALDVVTHFGGTLVVDIDDRAGNA
jgi:hypothetical protein